MQLANLLQDAWAVPRSSTKRIMPHTLNPTGIHSLPVELLVAVFVHGATFDWPYRDVDSHFLLKPDKRYAPPPCTNFSITVSHVCRHWRQVALRTHQLWTTIHVREKTHISRAQEYLARCSTSRVYLVDILIDTVALSAYVPGVTLYKDELEQIFKVIVPHIKSWRSFHLKICDNECKQVARDYLSTCGGGPSLETLQLYHFEHFKDVQHLNLTTRRPPVTIFNNDLPVLKNLSLIGVNLPWDRTPFLSNLDHLQLALHIEKVRPTYKDYAAILRKCPGVRTLSLHYSGPKEPTGEPALAWPAPYDDPIVLRQLDDLDVVDLEPDYLCALIRDLRIPALTKMSLSLSLEEDFTPFIQFLIAVAGPEAATSESASANAASSAVPSQVRSSFSLSRLQQLAIRGLDCEYSIWVTLLRSLTSVRFFEADFSRIPVGYSKALGLDSLDEATRKKMSCKTCPNDKPSRSVMLPRLETFKVAGLPGTEVLQLLSQRFHSSRLREPRRERWIILWNEDDRGIDVELDALVDEGFWCPPQRGNGASQSSVIVEVYDEPEDEEEEEDGEEGAEEAPTSAEDDDDESSESD